MSGAEFVGFDMYIKTNLPELGMNQSRSNIELFEDWFTDGSVVSRHSLPRPTTLFTTGTFTWQRVFVMRSTPILPQHDLLFSTRLFNPTSHSRS